ncbi:MAG: DUF3365 domain-containing protein [Gammaproteobacteria bacterium]|nr:DUF3365 domain-containing protein [Gammaproteobacteria bacterium]
MTHRTFRSVSALALGLMVAAGGARATDLEPMAATARDASAQLLELLKSTVTKATKEKGPVFAIETCNEKALPLTAELSGKLGIDVGRTSHKLRQPKNAPDAWETKVLEDFQARVAAGEKVEGMESYEVVEDADGKSFRYMQAIPLGGVCYNCHGDKIKPDLKAKLDELYPEDQARGFLPGDLRGAFTVKMKM